MSFCKAKEIKILKHSLDKMKERKIRDQQVYDCVGNGKMVEEKQDLGRDIGIVFQEATENLSDFYVVIAASHPLPEVVTFV